MKVALVAPPQEPRHHECFPMPNIAIATLGRRLRERGHEVTLHDLSIPFYREVAATGTWRELETLQDRSAVLRFLKTRRAGKGAPFLDFAHALLRRLSPPAGADLYGITLVDMKTPFLVNVAALIADGLRAEGGARVVIGSKQIPQALYAEILRDYPVFDFAAYRQGESELLGLMDRLSSRRRLQAPPPNVMLRDARGRVRVGEPHGYFPRVTFPDYAGYPLAEHARTVAEVLEPYDTRNAVFDELRREGGRRRQLIAMSRFETRCKGRCIFCSSVSFGDGRSLDDILAHLRGLKELGVTGVYFINANINNDYAFTEALCERMRRERLGLQWCDCVNFRQLDERLLDKMRRAGAVKLTFGLETGSERLLRYIRKGTTARKAARLLAHSHALGLWNHIEMIAGLPTETDDDVRRSIAFLEENAEAIDVHSLNPFYLYPDAPLHRTPERFGIRLLRGPARRLDHFSADEIVGSYSERFDEVGGLGWEEKNRQIADSTRRLTEAIARISPPLAVDGIHIDLLMCLYRLLGHDSKDVIRRLVRIATRRFRPFGARAPVVPTNDVKARYRRVLSPRGPS